MMSCTCSRSSLLCPLILPLWHWFAVLDFHVSGHPLLCRGMACPSVENDVPPRISEEQQLGLKLSGSGLPSIWIVSKSFVRSLLGFCPFSAMQDHGANQGVRNLVRQGSPLTRAVLQKN